jgi:Holliday junction resolvase RusA-like endonuclease
MDHMTPAVRVPRALQSITLPVPPSANDRLTIASDAATGKHRAFLTGEARRYRRGIAQLLLFLKPVPAGVDVAVTITWYRRSPEDGDVANREKVLCDCLSGHAFDDDRQIRRLVMERLDTEPHHPRVEITIEAVA